MNFIGKKVTVQKAMAILAKNDIQMDDQTAFVILDFLYLMSKNYNKPREEITGTQRTNRTSEKKTVRTS